MLLWTLSGADRSECHAGDIGGVVLGITLNFARRQLTPEQKREVVLKLRQRGWSQEKTAKAVGVGRATVYRAEKDVNNAQTGNIYIPDNRLKLNTKSRGEIVERIKAGEKHEQVAADFGVSRARVMAYELFLSSFGFIKLSRGYPSIL